MVLAASRPAFYKLVQCPRSSFQSKYLGMCKNPLISTAGGRFPRARLQPPRETHSAGSSDTCYSRWSRRLPFQSTRVALYTMWNHLRDNVPSNWNMRDSCGRKGEAAEKLMSYKNVEVFHQYTDDEINHQTIYSR